MLLFLNMKLKLITPNNLFINSRNINKIPLKNKNENIFFTSIINFSIIPNLIKESNHRYRCRSR